MYAMHYAANEKINNIQNLNIFFVFKTNENKIEAEEFK